MRKIEFEATEENILNIISRVKELELENGLSEEEIRKKYMNKDSGALALLIKDNLPNTYISQFGEGDCKHYCISINGDITKDSNLNSNPPQSRYYFNITGRHYYYDLIDEINKTLDLNPGFMTLSGYNVHPIINSSKKQNEEDITEEVQKEINDFKMSM